MRLIQRVCGFGLALVSGIAMADTPISHPSAGGGILSMLPMLLIFVVAFYFLLVRPQTKRAKEQRELMGGLSKGDEVAMAGGLVGRLEGVKENYVDVRVNDVLLTFKKSAVANVLPKGSLKSID